MYFHLLSSHCKISWKSKNYFADSKVCVIRNALQRVSNIKAFCSSVMSKGQVQAKLLEFCSKLLSEKFDLY